MKRTSYIPFLVLAVIILVTLACGASATPTLVSTSAPPAQASPEPTQPPAAPAPTATTPPAAPQEYKIGDVVSLGDHILTVLGWENIPSTDASKPDAGKKFIAVELIIVNNSQAAVSISTLMQMSLKDSTGQKYDVDFMASLAANSGSMDGELAPGEKVRGKVGFQVPENAQDLIFVFDAKLFSAGKVFVSLGNEPTKVDPPASFAGETTQQTYKIGEAVTAGSLVITINEITYPAGDQVYKPEAGKKFLVVDVTIENKSSQAANVSTLLQTWLKDSSGQKYTVDFMASMASGGAAPDGELAAGEKIRGQVGFQVPDSVTGLVFVFDANLFGAGKISVSIP